jgi:ribosomal protein L36
LRAKKIKIMDITNKLEQLTFFDFDRFTEEVSQHFKDNAELIDLTEQKIVSHNKTNATGGLVIEIYLMPKDRLLSERMDVSLSQMWFNIDVILAGEGQYTSQQTYNKLVRRTQILAFICENLHKHLNKHSFNGYYELGSNITTFSAVVDGSKNLDNIHNACRITGYFNAYF